MVQENILQNLKQIEERIARAAERSGRQRADVKLIVVSKAQPAEKIKAAYLAGARYFGENYPEETAGKIGYFSDNFDIEWHMIGHLQSRKAKIVAESFHMLQSLDSLHTAEKLNRILAESSRTLPCLIEINIGGEESKGGLNYSKDEQIDAIREFIKGMKPFECLSIEGLMTMPPLWEEPDKSRPYFSRLRNLKDVLEKDFPEISWRELSMGTSGDFETAIEEGSTMVRIGSAILGERVYPKKQTER